VAHASKGEVKPLPSQIKLAERDRYWPEHDAGWPAVAGAAAKEGDGQQTGGQTTTGCQSKRHLLGANNAAAAADSPLALMRRQQSGQGNFSNGCGLALGSAPAACSASVETMYMSGKKGKERTAATAFCASHAQGRDCGWRGRKEPGGGLGFGGGGGGQRQFQKQGPTRARGAQHTLSAPSKHSGPRPTLLRPPPTAQSKAGATTQACLLRGEHVGKGIAHKGHAGAVLVRHVGR
jgi:hypothetical protein